MARKKFQRKWFFLYEKDSRFNFQIISKSVSLIGQVPIKKYGLKTLFLLFNILDFELKKVLLPPPPLGNFADISSLEENFKPHLLRDVCTLCSGALVSDSLLHMLL